MSLFAWVSAIFYKQFMQLKMKLLSVAINTNNVEITFVEAVNLE